MQQRLAHQIAFLIEADKLKSIVRRTPLVDLSRQKNSAEHSWHLVLVVMVMREYGPRGIDWMRVIEMVAVHDLVEIDAGDVSAYDVEGLAAKAEREQVAAERIFGLLPADQQQQFRSRSSRTRMRRAEAGAARRSCARRFCAGWRRSRSRCRMSGRT